jgi:hypothetical protein
MSVGRRFEEEPFTDADAVAAAAAAAVHIIQRLLYATTVIESGALPTVTV